MKKYGRILIIVVIIAVLGLIGYFLLRDKGNPELSLDQLKRDGSYQYGEVKWGMSRKETEDVLDYKLILDEARKTEDSDKDYYISKKKVVLDKYPARVSFDYEDDALNTVKFQFRLGDDFVAWFEDKAEQLRELYGEPNDSLNNTNDIFGKDVSIRGYKWDTEETTLQILLISGEATPTVVIGVGVR